MAPSADPPADPPLRGPGRPQGAGHVGWRIAQACMGAAGFCGYLVVCTLLIAAAGSWTAFPLIAVAAAFVIWLARTRRAAVFYGLAGIVVAIPASIVAAIVWLRLR